MAFFKCFLQVFFDCVVEVIFTNTTTSQNNIYLALLGKSSIALSILLAFFFCLAYASFSKTKFCFFILIRFCFILLCLVCLKACYADLPQIRLTYNFHSLVLIASLCACVISGSIIESRLPESIISSKLYSVRFILWSVRRFCG